MAKFQLVMVISPRYVIIIDVAQYDSWRARRCAQVAVSRQPRVTIFPDSMKVTYLLEIKLHYFILYIRQHECLLVLET